MSKENRVLPWVLRGAAALAIVLLAATVGWLWYGHHQDQLTEQARTEALAAASKQAVAMLAYDFKDVDSQLASAAEGLTGSFRDDYNKLVLEAIAPGAKERQLNVQVTVQAASVISADADDAAVLLYLNQTTTSSDVPDARTSGSRVRVDLEEVDGRWLVNRLTPV